MGGTGEGCRDAGTVCPGRAWAQQQGHSPRLCEEGQIIVPSLEEYEAKAAAGLQTAKAN